MKKVCAFLFLIFVSSVFGVALRKAEKLPEAEPLELLQERRSEEKAGHLAHANDALNAASSSSSSLNNEDAEESEEEQEAHQHDEEQEEDEQHEEEEQREMEAAQEQQQQEQQQQEEEESTLMSTQATVKPTVSVAGANPATNAAAAGVASAATNVPLWYVTTMLGQAALSGGMGGLGRKTSAGPAHGGHAKAKLTPMAPELYHTALLATHLAVTHRAFHAGTIPTGLDDYERRTAVEEKQFRDFQKQQQMMQMYGGAPMGGAPMVAPPQYGQYPGMPMQPMQSMQYPPMMGMGMGGLAKPGAAAANPAAAAAAAAAYGMPQMYNPMMMQPMQGAPQAYGYGMPAYGAYMQQQQQQQQQPFMTAAKTAASVSSDKSKILLKGNKIQHLSSSLVSEIEAARGKRDY